MVSGTVILKMISGIVISTMMNLTARNTEMSIAQMALITSYMTQNSIPQALKPQVSNEEDASIQLIPLPTNKSFLNRVSLAHFSSWDITVPWHMSIAIANWKKFGDTTAPGSSRNMLIAQANLKNFCARAKNLQKHLLHMEYPWDIVAIQDPPPGILWLMDGIRRTYSLHHNTKRPATENDHPMHHGYDKVCRFAELFKLCLW